MLKTLNIDSNIDYLNAPHDSVYEINFKNWWKKQQIINACDVPYNLIRFRINHRSSHATVNSHLSNKNLSLEYAFIKDWRNIWGENSNAAAVNR